MERYHGKAGKQCRCPAGSLQLGPAQVQLPPGERLQGVLVQTHRVKPCSSRSQSQAERAEMTSLVRTHVQQHRRPRGPLANKPDSKMWPAGATAEAAASLPPCLSPPSRLTRRVCRACCTAAVAAPYTTHNAVRRGKNPCHPLAAVTSVFWFPSSC